MMPLMMIRSHILSSLTLHRKKDGSWFFKRMREWMKIEMECLRVSSHNFCFSVKRLLEPQRSLKRIRRPSTRSQVLMLPSSPLSPSISIYLSLSIPLSVTLVTASCFKTLRYFSVPRQSPKSIIKLKHLSFSFSPLLPLQLLPLLSRRKIYFVYLFHLLSTR